MSTAQSYVGRGNYAIAPPQPAKNQAVTYQPAEESQPINPRIFEAQSRLLDLEDRFAQRGNYAPVQVAEDLLLHWFITDPQELTAENDPDQLHVILMLLDTLDEAYAIDGLPSRNRKGLRTEPSRLYQKYTKRLSPDFANLFELTEQEEPQAGLISMPDERMAPQIRCGSSVVVVSLCVCQYAQASGIVLLATHSAPDQPLSGRIIENDGSSILLLPDNPAYCEQRVCFSTIRFLSSVRYVLNQPVL